MDFPVLEQIHRVGTAFRQFEEALHLQSSLLQHRGGPGGGDQFKAEIGEELGHAGDFLFMRVAHTNEHPSTHRQRPAGGNL